MSRSPYRLALIGAADESHNTAPQAAANLAPPYLAALAQLRRQFQIAWICGPDAGQASTLAQSCGAKGTDRIDAILDDPAVDIVDLCLPPHLQVRLTLRALEAGKHVVCAAPLASDPNTVARIAAAAKQADRLVFPAAPYRYGIATRILGTLQRRALLGPLRVATLETHWAEAQGPQHRPWQGFGTGDPGSRDLGGALHAHAGHLHDLLSLIDGPVAEVSAALPDATAPGAGGHCAAIWMRTEAGALVTSSVSLGAAQDHNRLRLIFEAATIESAGAGDHPAAQVWHITPRDPARKKDFRDAEEATMLKPGPHYDRIAGVYSARRGAAGRAQQRRSAGKRASGGGLGDGDPAFGANRTRGDPAAARDPRCRGCPGRRATLNGLSNCGSSNPPPGCARSR